MTGAALFMKGMIFDLDDTLAPEKEYVLSGFRAVASYLGKLAGCSESACFEKMKEFFEQGRRKNVFDALLEEFTIPETAVTVGELVELYRSHEPDVHYRLYDDVPGFLDFFTGRYRCALVTDGFTRQQQKKIEALGIGAAFSPVYINEDRRFFKPHPHAYEGIIAAWRIEPHEIAVVGDNPAKDFITPRKMGMLTVRVRRQGFYRRVIGQTEGRADFSVRDFRELADLIGMQHRVTAVKRRKRTSRINGRTSELRIQKERDILHPVRE